MTELYKKVKVWHGVLFLALVSVVYFLPNVTGKKLYRHDIENLNMSNRSYKDKIQSGVPYWDAKKFSGMPLYLSYNKSVATQTRYIADYSLGKLLKSFASSSFLIALCFFLMMHYGLRVNVLLSVLAAALFAWSTYNMDILKAGHNWKVATIGYAFLFYWGMFEIFLNKRLRLGFVVTALGMSWMLVGKHFQVIYYIGLSVFLFWLVWLIDLAVLKLKKQLVQSKVKEFVTTTVTLGIAVLVGIGLNITLLNTSYQFSKQTIRGKSDLVTKDTSTSKKSGGLDTDYAFQWSYGKVEFMNLFFANAMGGASSNTPTTDSHTYKELVKKYGERQSRQTIGQLPLYWGDQPFVGAPYYIGIIGLVVLILSFRFLPRRMRWWFVVAGLLSILMAFGRNLMWFNEYLFHHLPLLNKFRAVTTSMIVFMIMIPSLAFYALDRMLKSLNHAELQHEIRSRLKYLGILFGGMLLVGFVLSFTGHPIDKSLENYGLLKFVIEDRQSLFYTNVFRNLFLSAIAVVLLYYWKSDKDYTKYIPFAFGLVALFDVFNVSWQYFNHSHFQDTRNYMALSHPKPTQIDREILKDKSYHRVLDYRGGSPINNNRTSYFHHSLGGYDPAKLLRYQELWDRYMSGQHHSKVVSNMLNAKYIITNKNKLIVNQDALGNAWFVEHVKMVSNANEEMESIAALNPETSCVMDKSKFSLDQLDYEIPVEAQLKLTSQDLNVLTFESSNQNDGFVVFSEIYYPEDRILYIDDQPVELKRVNYVLSGARVPKGTHKLRLEFKPNLIYAYKWVEYVSMALLIGLVFINRKKKK